jgi:hypothetical protein
LISGRFRCTNVRVLACGVDSLSTVFEATSRTYAWCCADSDLNHYQWTWTTLLLFRRNKQGPM